MQYSNSKDRRKPVLLSPRHLELPDGIYRDNQDHEVRNGVDDSRKYGYRRLVEAFSSSSHLGALADALGRYHQGKSCSIEQIPSEDKPDAPPHCIPAAAIRYEDAMEQKHDRYFGKEHGDPANDLYLIEQLGTKAQLLALLESLRSSVTIP